MANRTFTIIKPDSVRKGNFGKIISRLEAEGFRVLGLKKVSLGRKQAEGFYAVHRERPFFPSLVEYMTSGPVYVVALERENAVPHLRQVMDLSAFLDLPCDPFQWLLAVLTDQGVMTHHLIGALYLHQTVPSMPWLPSRLLLAFVALAPPFSSGAIT